LKSYDVAPIEGFVPEIGTLIATWEDGAREWLENLGDPPIEVMFWQPFPNGPSIGGIMLHMACCDLYWIKKFAAGSELDAEHPAVAYDSQLDQDNVNWPTPPNQPFAWYLEILKTTRNQMIQLIRQEPDPEREFQRSWGTLTFRWVVAHIVEHDSYHGGQCVLLHELWKRQPK
jgi:uncharacterized damage-inducible protein DinB